MYFSLIGQFISYEQYKNYSHLDRIGEVISDDAMPVANGAQGLHFRSGRFQKSSRDLGRFRTRRLMTGGRCPTVNLLYLSMPNGGPAISDNRNCNRSGVNSFPCHGAGVLVPADPRAAGSHLVSSGFQD